MIQSYQGNSVVKLDFFTAKVYNKLVKDLRHYKRGDVV